MEENNSVKIEEFIAKEMLLLNLKFLTIKKASRTFNISIEEAKNHYSNVRPKVRKEALSKAFIYLLLGSVSLFVGIAGTFGNTGYIFWGSLLFGSGFLLTAIGLFILVLKK